MTEKKFKELSEELDRLHEEWSEIYEEQRKYENGYDRIYLGSMKYYLKMSLHDAKVQHEKDVDSYQKYKRLEKKSLRICGKEISVKNKIKRALQ